MLKERIISAFFMLIVLLIINFVVNDALFVLAMGLLAGTAAWEWSRLSGVTNPQFQLLTGLGTGALVALSVFLLPAEATGRWFSLFCVLFWAGVGMMFYLQPIRDPDKNNANIGLMLIGIVVLFSCTFFTYYLHTESLNGSPWLVIYALAVIWAMDIGAYFSGKRWGRKKLAPIISPGKTWEGVYGGVACTVLLMLCVLTFSPLARQHAIAIIAGTLLAGIASVLGDLFESRLKRASGVKDSSQLIRGHGGLLDRIDGVIAAVPAFAFAWIWL